MGQGASGVRAGSRGAGRPPVVAEPRWRHFFDGLVALSMGVGAIGLVLNVGTARTGVLPGVLCAVLGVVAAGLWWGGLRRGTRPLLAWAFTAAVLAMLVLSDGPIFLLLGVVAVALLTVQVGPARAAVVAVLAGPLLGVSAWIAYGDHEEANPLGFVLDGVFVSLSMGLAVILGGLLLHLQQTRWAALTANAELERANQRLQETMSLERDLVLAEERARSSRELHDGLGARLTVISMSLEYALRARERDPDRAWAEVARAAEGNREALDHMRLWVRALSPPQMSAVEGGAAAFDAIADSFRGTGLSVRVEHDGERDSLPPRVAGLAYRLVQEGLTNALRHAGATEVTIEVRQTPEQVRIAVRDDGTATAVPVEGFGLRGLREHATELGGRLSAQPREGGGFELLAVLPLVEAQPGTAATARDGAARDGTARDGTARDGTTGGRGR